MSGNSLMKKSQESLSWNALIQKLIHLFYYLWMFCVIAFSDNVTLYANLCSLVMMGLCMLYLLARNSAHFPISILLWLMFVVFAGASCLWSIAPSISLRRTETVLLLSIMLVLVGTYAVTSEDKSFLIDGFEYVALALSVYVVAVYGLDIMIDAVRNGSLERVGEEFVNSNALGIHLSIGALVMLFKAMLLGKHKRIFLVIVPTVIALLTGSRKSIGILIIGVVYIVLLQMIQRKADKRYLKSFFVAATVILILVALYNSPAGSLVKSRVESMFAEGAAGDASSAERQRMIQIGLEQFKQNPMFGCGIGTSSVLVGSYLHNNYVELLATTGIFGVVLYYGFILHSIKCLLLKRKSTILQKMALLFGVLLLVIDIGSVSYFTKTTYMLLAILVAFRCDDSNVLEEREIKND